MNIGNTVKTWVKLEVFTLTNAYQCHFLLQMVVQHDWSIETKGAGLTSPQVEVAEGRAHLNFGDESCLSSLIAGNDEKMRKMLNQTTSLRFMAQFCIYIVKT